MMKCYLEYNVLYTSGSNKINSIIASIIIALTKSQQAGEFSDIKLQIASKCVINNIIVNPLPASARKLALCSVKMKAFK